jgi:hypothetical protein
MADKSLKPAPPPTFSAWMWAVLTVLVPIVVTALTQMSGAFQKSRELDIKMIELGVGILRAAPEEKTGTKYAREWAVDVIENYSDVHFKKEARQHLIDNPLLVVTPSSSSDNSSGAWVAVGFLGPNQGDQNFTLLNGNAITALPPGTTIKAKSSVNVRPNPANWGSVSSVLNSGQCFSVSETRALKAGDRDQVWARGDVADCTPK